MIEKLDVIKHTDNLYDKNGFITNVACGEATISKVNELIDAVNELQEFADVADKNLAKLMEEATCSENVQPDAESRSENMQDKFAQYRDWAGKLCRFWNVDKDKAIYGILEEVKADWAYRFQKKGENYLFDHCEPVKPDEDIIYRGE